LFTISLDQDVVLSDIERTQESFPTRTEVQKAIENGVEKTARQFAERVNEEAPESTDNQYDASYGDPAPSVELSNSFVARSSGESPSAYEVISIDDERAYFLEVGTSGTEIEADDDSALAIYAPQHPDANEDGRIFRNSAQLPPTEGRRYVFQVFKEFKSQGRLERNVQEELDKIL